MKTLNTITKLHTINGQEFVSTYKLCVRSGQNSETLHCVDVDHAYTDGRTVAMNGIICTEDKNKAFYAFKVASESNAWGSM